MQFGVQFFPNVRPSEKSAMQYFAESLDVVEAADRLGFRHIRIVEHYFHHYGGYSPNPIVFLAAASQRSKQIRLVTGAVLPVFNHPLKLAGEIGMLDAISGGRLDVGFARAFLPHEFRRFGISPDESVARFREGLDQIDHLLREEHVSSHGQFHSYDDVTSMPRPTQLPRPKFYVAVSQTPASFVWAGTMGYSIMAIPLEPTMMRGLIASYREAWRAAGHPGDGEVMLAFSMFCHEDGLRAREIAKPLIEAYFEALVEATAEWDGQSSSRDYPDYDRMAKNLKKQTLETQMASGSAWIGTPAEIRDTIERVAQNYGQIEHASLQVNFTMMPRDEALRSIELFARDVMPYVVNAT